MEQTLLLNATYEPLKVVNWQKAVTLWCQGKVEIIIDISSVNTGVDFLNRQIQGKDFFNWGAGRG